MLPYRYRDSVLEVMLVHPGGPFWKNKDRGAWSIPKGEVEPDEDLLAAARRELCEETGFVAAPPFWELGRAQLASGKHVVAWAFESDADPALLQSNEIDLEWPPRSGRRARFPEVDRAGWFGLAEARKKINSGQLPLLAALEQHLGASPE